MKISPALIMFITILVTVGCRQRSKVESEQKMLMPADSILTDKNIALVKIQDTVRPEEKIPDLEKQPNIMIYDLDSVEKIPSKEIRLVKPGEALRPSEK
jgi:hypothetical protein